MAGRAISVTTDTDYQSTITCANSSPSENSYSPSGVTAATSVSNSNSPLVPPGAAPPTPRPRLGGDDKNAPVVGWPEVAQQISEVPEWEAFPRFRELNVKNLLYYQVELQRLQDLLRRDERLDSKRRGCQKEYRKFADAMIENKDSEDPKECKQWKRVLEIRTLLREYNAALLQHAQISALPHPDSDHIETLRQWLVRADYGNFCISGYGREAWDLENAPPIPDTSLTKRIPALLGRLVWPRPRTRDGLDLAATFPRPHEDGLSRWVTRELLPFIDEVRKRMNLSDAHRTNGGGGPGKIYRYTGTMGEKVSSTVGTIVASLLPTVAIGILMLANGKLQVLGCIAAFTGLFSALLMFATAASKVQVFTATAAFSAVLVVFAQNQ